MKSNHILWWYKASLNSSCSFYSWLINMYFHHRCCARKARKMNLLWRNHYMWGRVSNGIEKAIENGIHRKEIMKNNESVFCVTVITIAVDRHSHQHYMYLFLIRFLPTHAHAHASPICAHSLRITIIPCQKKIPLTIDFLRRYWNSINPRTEQMLPCTTGDQLGLRLQLLELSWIPFFPFMKNLIFSAFVNCESPTTVRRVLLHWVHENPIAIACNQPIPINKLI